MEQKRIVIVGASSGLGRLVAEECARTGWRVGVAARNETALKDIKERYGATVEYERIDITDEASGKQLQSLVEKLGGMDIYFHVSGILTENPELDVATDVRTVDTNVAGFTRMIDTAFNYFRSAGTVGRIAAITSVAGTKGIADLASYSASKRYQWTYLQALEQLARRERLPISFTDIRPGWTRTPLIDDDRSYLMAMRPEKVAKAALRAIIRRKRVAVIDRRWAIMSCLWRLVPSWVWTRIPLRASEPKG